MPPLRRREMKGASFGVGRHKPGGTNQELVPWRPYKTEGVKLVHARRQPQGLGVVRIIKGGTSGACTDDWKKRRQGEKARLQICVTTRWGKRRAQVLRCNQMRRRAVRAMEGGGQSGIILQEKKREGGLENQNNSHSWEGLKKRTRAVSREREEGDAVVAGDGGGTIDDPYQNKGGSKVRKIDEKKGMELCWQGKLGI